MGIRVTERLDMFRVPYGVPNDEGTPEVMFVDLKAHPEWIPVLAPCVGWPETQALLATINASASPLMSLAADQAFTTIEDDTQPAVLTSFVTLCFADVPSNSRLALQHLAGHLAARLRERLQLAANRLARSLPVDALFEIQPTAFHLPPRAGSEWRTMHSEPSWESRQDAGRAGSGWTGWSLTIALAARGRNQGESREVWGLAVTALDETLGGTMGGEA